MPERLPSHFVDLVQDVLLKSFWRKPTLRNFLLRHKVKESFLATWAPEETKREFLIRLIPKLETTDTGQYVIKQMAVSLAEQIKFPDLEGWEDSDQKIKAAKEAVAALRTYLESEKRKAESAKEKEAIRARSREKQQEEVARRQTLETLSTRLAELYKKAGTSEGGYAFQDWFYDLVDYYEVVSRRPYMAAGRQIDGSITVEGTTYLVELKFTNEQTGAPDVDTFLAKINDKADNTMGVMVSMAGYSSVAVQQASGRRTPIILMDYGHVMALLQGTWTLPEIVARLRRHVSQTGEAYLQIQSLIR